MPLETVRFDAPLLGREAAMLVAKPEGDGPFPVLHLHHGLGNTFRTFAKRTDILKLAEQRGVLVAMPEAEKSWGCDDPREGGLPWQRHLVEEVVAAVDARFPTIADRNARFIGGFSMGGYTAMLLAVKYPETFSAVYSLAGSYLFGHETRPDRPERTPFMMAVAPPGGPNDLFRLTTELAGSSTQLRIAFDVGLDDHLLDINRRFHAHLDTAGLAHRYEEVDGGHDWEYVNRRLPRVLERLLSS